MKSLIVGYGLVVLVAYALVAYRPDYFGNVGFLVVGTLIGIYPAFLIEEFRSTREKERMTIALFHELANRVARCCFDFENPWKAYYRQPQNMDIARLRRFAPDPPVIYPSVAAQIATFRSDAIQSLILFYAFLAAWQRDIESTADECVRHSSAVLPDHVRRLARRLRNTLKPGQDILEKLSGRVPGAEQIELDAIAELDRLFPEKHPNAGKPLRERISIALRESDN